MDIIVVRVDSHRPAILGVTALFGIDTIATVTIGTIIAGASIIVKSHARERERAHGS